MYAFYDCVNLKSITIPESVETIYRYAFGYKSADYDYREDEPVPGVVIKCVKGSKGEEYAKGYNLKYKLIDS